ncbi:class I SAM-dependent methyltransferase [Pseudoalteromonas sp. SSM20]|uniref:class I SAM-dependent methyltransferase n=1 Tax=unclassified Pseudoalteromonas TaxID=194690 RepID=UPI00237ED696|nr:class I SAM-dependent methyltransferase [Pseudoalteromonas sp. G4]MDE3271735.1 class I SAM-dependent methyltransferase [Pseudoalteromonas sp. G4]
MKDLKDYYQQLFRMHGATHNAVQHVSKHSQEVRFALFQKLIDNDDDIIDLGCGLGDMLPYMRKNGFKGNYLGCDFVPEFISFAKKSYSNDSKASFIEFDIYNDSLPNNYNHVLISGIFNNLMDDNLSFIKKTLLKSYEACSSSVIFNALSDYVEYQDSELFYVSPLLLFDYCKRSLSPYISLTHDYVTKEGGFPYEFTMQISKSSKEFNK